MALGVSSENCWANSSRAGQGEEAWILASLGGRIALSLGSGQNSLELVLLSQYVSLSKYDGKDPVS